MPYDGASSVKKLMKTNSTLSHVEFVEFVDQKFESLARKDAQSLHSMAMLPNASTALSHRRRCGSLVSSSPPAPIQVSI